MQFRSWVLTQPWGTLKRLEREHGIPWTTLARLMRDPAARVTDKHAETLVKVSGGLITKAEVLYVPELRRKSPPRKYRPARTRKDVDRALARIQAKQLKKTG